MISSDEALGITLGVTIAYQLFFFFIAAYFKFDTVTDLAGGSNFVVIAVLIFVLNCIPIPSSRQLANTVLVILWGIRLSGFLLYRVLAFTKDNRFDDIRENFFKFLFFWIFQMVWVWVVSLPLTYLNSINDSARPTLDSADIVGIIMASLGLVIEAWSDQSKLYSKLDPAKKNTWCTDGLWKYSRHPNYFGELLFWWGIFISCSQSYYQQNNIAFYTILSPLFITLLLLGFSGMPILEKSANTKYGSSAEYQKYRKETSILVIMPNALYRNIPDVLKCLFLFEWPVYRAGLVDPTASVSSFPVTTTTAPLVNESITNTTPHLGSEGAPSGLVILAAVTEKTRLKQFLGGRLQIYPPTNSGLTGNMNQKLNSYGSFKTDKDKELDDFIRGEEQYLQMVAANKKQETSTQLDDADSEQPKLVAIVSRKETAIRKLPTTQNVFENLNKKSSEYAKNYESDYAQRIKVDSASNDSVSKVRSLKKISKRSLIILKRYIDSDPLTLEQRLKRIDALSEPRKNPYEQFPIKLEKNKQLEKERAAAPWRDANEIDYSLRVSNASNVDTSKTFIASAPNEGTIEHQPRPPSRGQLQRSYNHSRASILRQQNSDASKAVGDQVRTSRSPSPPLNSANQQVELVIESKPCKIQISSSSVSPADGDEKISPKKLTGYTKASKVAAATTFVPVNRNRISKSFGVSDSKPLEWSKQFGVSGRIVHRKRDKLSEKKRNRPLPSSQSEHLLDLIDEMVHKLCKKLAFTMNTSMKFADDHRNEVSRDILALAVDTTNHTTHVIMPNNSRSQSSLHKRFVSYNPRTTDTLMEQAVHAAVEYSHGVVQFQSIKSSAKKCGTTDTNANAHENILNPTPECADDGGDDFGAVGEMNESMSLSISSHGSLSKQSLSRPSSAASKSKPHNHTESLKDVLKLLSSLPNHRPLEEIATVYSWLLYSRTKSSNNATSAVLHAETRTVSASSSSHRPKSRSRSLLRFTKSLLFEFSELVKGTREFFESYNKVYSDRGTSTVREEPQRERILMESMHCWHTDVGQRISELQYESLCRSVKSTLSISRSFIYSQVSVVNDSLVNRVGVDTAPPFGSPTREDIGPISKQINAAVTGKSLAQGITEDVGFGVRAISASATYDGEEERTLTPRTASPRSTSNLMDKNRRKASTPNKPVSAGTIRRIGRNLAPTPPSQSDRRAPSGKARPSSAGMAAVNPRRDATRHTSNDNNDTTNTQEQQEHYSSRAANSVLTRMHFGRFVFWNAASPILCERDEDAVFTLNKRQLKEFSRNKIVTDDAYAMPSDDVFEQCLDFDARMDGHKLNGTTAAGDFHSSSGHYSYDHVDTSNPSISRNASSSVHPSASVAGSEWARLGHPPPQQQQQQSDKELLFHRFAPDIDRKQQLLMETAIFSDVCQSLVLSVFVLLKHTGAGKEISLNDVVLLLGNYTSEVLGRRLLDKLLFWLHSNRRTDASFKPVNQTHLEMALQRLYGFWPSLKINLRMQPSKDFDHNTNDEGVPPSPSCQVVLHWQNRLRVTKVFRDPNSYEPNINLI